DWADAHPKVWLDCVRIYLGLGLFIRGLFIITNTRAEFIADLLKRMEYPWVVTVVLLHYIAMAHLVGGLMLTVGLLTRIGAWVQIPILAGALFVHRNEGLMSGGQSLEFSALVFFLLVIFAFSGAGPLSVDNGMPKLKPAITP
ncbi:MAG TPA: DoxX family protein, partial [Lacunisphaera sp.]|nr:DoxX family protein [Lacunisphaera sp.]